MEDHSAMNAGVPGPLVGTGWLAGELGAADLRVLDCSVTMHHHDDGSYSFSSGLDKWQRQHIPGSVHADVLQALSDPAQAIGLMMPPPAALAEIMATHLGVGDGTRVVLYDDSNHAWAARVWWMLRCCGFDHAAVLDGGLQKWLAEGRPVTTTPADYPPATFTVRPRPQLMAGKEDVQSQLGKAGVTLIHALSPEAFSGKVSLFPRPGRIPGSRNVFCQALVDTDSHALKDRDTLRELFRPSGALEAERVITYCGGGIAASADALALTLLGVRNVAVYDGSLSEWTADPTLPMETGAD